MLQDMFDVYCVLVVKTEHEQYWTKLKKKYDQHFLGQKTDRNSVESWLGRNFRKQKKN